VWADIPPSPLAEPAEPSFGAPAEARGEAEKPTAGERAAAFAAGIDAAQRAEIRLKLSNGKKPGEMANELARELRGINGPLRAQWFGYLKARLPMS
jgi:hypothetical protein